MEIAKALILAGNGPDHVSWPVAPRVPRHLFPIANRPILVHNLEALRAAGVLEATIMAEPEAAGAIEHAVGDGSDWDLRLHVVPWPSDVGLRGALASGREFVGDEPVLVQRGDALLRERMSGHIAAFAREGLDALALRLVAKARTIATQAPGYLLSPRAVSILAEGPHGAGGPLAGVRARGGRVRVQQVEGLLPCDGGRSALLDGNRALLEGLAGSVPPESVEDSVLQGPVEVHPTARVRRSTLRGPLIVGPRATVTESYVGPYTSVGADVTLDGVELEHSIVLPEAELRYVGTRIESSVIGRGARVTRTFPPPGALPLTLGDGAEVVVA